MPWIYHELQDAALCGVHCLNNLLQGPYFGAAELMEIALDLDAKERELMAELGTDTADYQKYAKQGSVNVGMSGDFSANVLQAALERAWGLSCSDTRSPDKKAVVANPTAEDGFLCNLEDHWIALRKIDGSWWNLNSLEDAPQYLSDLYLGVFLKQLEIEGWTIYVVQGEFPATSLSRSGQEWRFCQPGTAADKRSTPSDFEDSIGNEDAELEAALIASLADATPAKQTPASAQEPAQEYIDDDEELRLAIEMSKQMDAEAGEESK